MSINGALNTLAEVTGTSKHGTNGNDVYGSVNFLTRVCNNASQTISALRFEAPTREAGVRAIAELANYLGFEDYTPNDPDSFRRVADEALKVLKELQFNDEWKVGQPLRVGHIVRQGTVEAIEDGSGSERLVCVKTRDGLLATMMFCEVMQLSLDEKAVRAVAGIFADNCRDVSDAQMMVYELWKKGVITINPERL